MQFLARILPHIFVPNSGVGTPVLENPGSATAETYDISNYNISISCTCRSYHLLIHEKNFTLKMILIYSHVIYFRVCKQQNTVQNTVVHYNQGAVITPPSQQGAVLAASPQQGLVISPPPEQTTGEKQWNPRINFQFVVYWYHKCTKLSMWV